MYGYHQKNVNPCDILGGITRVLVSLESEVYHDLWQEGYGHYFSLLLFSK